MIFYVAVNGGDRWSGRLPEPNAARTDGPLATLAGARDAVRRLEPEPGGKGGNLRGLGAPVGERQVYRHRLSEDIHLLVGGGDDADAAPARAHGPGLSCLPPDFFHPHQF